MRDESSSNKLINNDYQSEWQQVASKWQRVAFNPRVNIR